MNVEYDKFAKIFSESRKNLKWPELDYLLKKYDFTDKSILDVGCGNGRLLTNILENGLKVKDYLGIDLSQNLLDEASKIHPNTNFLKVNMLDLSELKNKNFDYIFFVASFHHLYNIENRIKVLENIKKILAKNGKIFFTNWNLLGQIQYESDKIVGSENEFLSCDFNVKISNFDRFYHSFSIDELQYLFEENNFTIIENRIFEGEKNIISIISK